MSVLDLLQMRSRHAEESRDRHWESEAHLYEVPAHWRIEVFPLGIDPGQPKPASDRHRVLDDEIAAIIAAETDSDGDHRPGHEAQADEATRFERL